MTSEPTNSGFQGLHVGALESRMAPEMERLIVRHGGAPLVAPSMQEIPLSNHPEAIKFGQNLLSGKIDMAILLTGVGCRTLMDILTTQWPLESLTHSLGQSVLVVRGPKPAVVLKDLGLIPHIVVPEPNTWKDILHALDASYPEGLAGIRIAVQEYGVSNPELLAGLTERGGHVTPVRVYKWGLPDDLQPMQNLLRQVIDGKVSVLLITNAVQVDHIIKVLGDQETISRFRQALPHMMIASIGHIASERLRQHEFPVDLEPSHPKMGILVKEASQAAHQILEAKRQSL